MGIILQIVGYGMIVMALLNIYLLDWSCLSDYMISCKEAKLAWRLSEAIVDGFIFLVLPGFILAGIGVYLCKSRAKCPFCAETIKRKATVCKFCHKDLPHSSVNKANETI